MKQTKYLLLHIDEKTDVAGETNLLAFVHSGLSGVVEEEMLFRQYLLTKTTTEEVFKLADNFIK